MSLVRSNDDGEVGFLGEKRRLNGTSTGALGVLDETRFCVGCIRLTQTDSCHDTAQAGSNGDRRLGNGEKVSCHSPPAHL